MKFKALMTAALAVLLTGISFINAQTNEKWDSKPGLYAVLQTSKGNIVSRLFEKEAPITVTNFVELAQGNRDFLDLNTKQKVRRPFYDKLIFHRVIPNFMIQAGCPLGTGTGGPGYRFGDEIVPGLIFNAPGKLAMANSGPGTNGSQFFITQVPTPWLNGKHTIFGEVVSGMDVVNKIAGVERNQMDKPITPVVLKKVVIKRVGEPEPAKSETKPGKKALFIVAPEMYNEEEYGKTKNILETGGITVVTASLKKGEITGMAGGKAVSDITINEVKSQDYDAIVYIGGQGSQVFWSNSVAHQIAKEAAAQNKTIGAICLAPGTLAKAGLLKGKKVTGFYSLQNDFKNSGADYTSKPTECDGNIITGSGPEASEAFGNAVLEALKK